MSVFGANRVDIFKGLLIFVVFTVYSVNAHLNGDCVTPNKENAKCIPITSCTVIMTALSTRNETAQAFARDSFCGYDGETPLVCCGTTAYPRPPSLNEIFGLFGKPPPSVIQITTPTSEKKKMQPEPLEDFKTNALPDRSICGMERDSGRIWGGTQTELDEFPWMAALEYERKRDKTNVGVRCGGSLINSKFVLTAAHCLVHREFKLINVRLGEWDVSTDPDCQEMIAQNECADEVMTVPVAEQIPHPYYTRSGNNDIGLVKLIKDVTYTEFVRPICLPPRNLPLAAFDTLLTVCGWGVTENGTASNIKLKVSVPLLSNEICLKKLQGKPIGANQMCAGGELGKDSCQGDSGGPLMRTYENPITKQNQWYQDGVVSVGVGCARAGYPAVYTRVDRYIKWIIDTITEEDDDDDDDE